MSPPPQPWARFANPTDFHCVYTFLAISGGPADKHGPANQHVYHPHPVSTIHVVELACLSGCPAALTATANPHPHAHSTRRLPTKLGLLFGPFSCLTLKSVCPFWANSKGKHSIKGWDSNCKRVHNTIHIQWKVSSTF